MSQTTTQHMYRFFRFSDLTVRLSQSLLALTVSLAAPNSLLAQGYSQTLTVHNTCNVQVQINYGFSFDGAAGLSGQLFPGPGSVVSQTRYSGQYNYPTGIYAQVNNGVDILVGVGKATIYVGCDDILAAPDPAIPDNRGSSGGPPECGMPVWSISQPFISLGLNDEPLGYRPAIGPRVSFSLSYKQRGDANADPNVFGVGPRWYSSWVSCMKQDPLTLANPPVATNMIAILPDGRRASFVNSNNFDANIRISGDSTNGFTLTYPNGAKDVYGFVVNNFSQQFLEAFLTEKWNELGQKMTFEYGFFGDTAPEVRLKQVIDGDGLINTITYVTTNSFSENLISQITDPFGRNTYLSYDSQGNLTNITDTAGLSSSCGYDFQGCITNLTTPYGSTSFTIADEKPTTNSANGRGRSILVTLPDSSHELYLYTNSAAGVPSSWDPVKFLPCRPIRRPSTRVVSICAPASIGDRANMPTFPQPTSRHLLRTTSGSLACLIGLRPAMRS